MPYPEHVERLRHISIDTLGLSDSTSALLKWFGYTCVLDCIIYFYEAAHYTSQEISDPWPRLYLLLFDEVKPALIAAGYWDLVMDIEMGRALDEHKWRILLQKGEQRIVHWQGKDQDLNNIPFEQLGLSDIPIEMNHRLASIGDCMTYFFYRLGEEPKHWPDLGTYQAFERPTNEPLNFDAYMFGVAQPRLVELGYWRLVEDYLEDVIEEGRFTGDFDWEDDEEEGDEDDGEDT